MENMPNNNPETSQKLITVEYTETPAQPVEVQFQNISENPEMDLSNRYPDIVEQVGAMATKADEMVAQSTAIDPQVANYQIPSSLYESNK